MKTSIKICCSLFFAVATAGISAELNPLFQNNAVLQCDARVPVWGAARDGEKITVTFAGQEVSTVAANGAWKTWLQPMNPNATPQTLTVAGGTINAQAPIEDLSNIEGFGTLERADRHDGVVAANGGTLTLTPA